MDALGVRYFGSILCTRKIYADGSDMKYKEILVAKGYSQVHCFDYTDTFEPVANMDSIRLVLADS